MHEADETLSASSWTSEEIELLQALRPCCSSSEICQIFAELGYIRTVDSITTKARRLRVHFRDFTLPDESQFEDPEVWAAVERVLSARTTYLNNLADDFLPKLPPTAQEKSLITSTKRRVIKELFCDLLEERRQTPRKTQRTYAPSRGSNKQSLCLVLSDLHLGEQITDPETGYRLYDLSIAEERLSSIPDLIQLTVPTSSVDEMVVLLAGDLVDGETIFDAQPMTIEADLSIQFKETVKIIWRLLLRLAEIYPRVRVVTCRGNHGRAGGISPDTNWDRIIYLTLECLIDQLDTSHNISIKNIPGEYNTFEIKGWKGLLRHIAPLSLKTASGRSKIAGWWEIHNYDMMVYGHYHHPGWETYNNKHILRNGCLPGGNDYSEKMGLYDKPGQLLFGVSEKELPTFVKILTFE